MYSTYAQGSQGRIKTHMYVRMYTCAASSIRKPNRVKQQYCGFSPPHHLLNCLRCPPPPLQTGQQCCPTGRKQDCVSLWYPTVASLGGAGEEEQKEVIYTEKSCRTSTYCSTGIAISYTKNITPQYTPVIQMPLHVRMYVCIYKILYVPMFICMYNKRWRMPLCTSFSKFCTSPYNNHTERTTHKPVCCTGDLR